MTSKNYDFFTKNQKMIELFDKAESGDCQECICHLMSEYANYAGYIDSDGDCVHHDEAQFCAVDGKTRAKIKEGKIPNYHGAPCIFEH